MKTKIIIAYSILLMVSIQNLFCQRNTAQNCHYSTDSEPCLTGELLSSVLTIDAITYFNSEWLYGDIYLSKGEVVRNKLIKYNGLLDELFWQESKSKNTIKLDKEPIVQFHYQNLHGDTSVYFRKIKVKHSLATDSSEIFCEAVYSGNVSLFVFHTFITGQKELVYKNGTPFEKDNYLAKPIYYFRSMNNKTFETRSLNKKSMYNISPVNKESIKMFYKSTKIRKFTKKSDQVKLAQFLNTIEIL